ncbi:MAG: ribonuclease Z [Parcubacteria group bacterium]|jgi:ribonuclease Z
MTINLTFLGTSDAVPTITRNHTAILLTYEGENILFDCGEGTQRQFKKAKINPCKLTRILVSHWHADHILGIPGLLQTLSLSGYGKKLKIYGPRGTTDFMKKILGMFVFRGEQELEVEDVSGKFLNEKDFSIEARAMTHGAPCNAYVFLKKGQIRIDKKKLQKLKIPSSPLLADLKKGKDITYNEKKYKAKELTFKEEDKKIAVVLDTSFNDSIIPFVKNADVLICEATFSSEMEEKAKEYKHLTSKQAAEIAKKANVKKLILTHISQRYEQDKEKILLEARKTFKKSFMANDFDVLEI